MDTAQIQTIARQLFEMQGSKAIAVAAQKALTLERHRDTDQAQTWRHNRGRARLLPSASSLANAWIQIVPAGGRVPLCCVASIKVDDTFRQGAGHRGTSRFAWSAHKHESGLNAAREQKRTNLP
jgi:hypothetical protein